VNGRLPVGNNCRRGISGPQFLLLYVALFAVTVPVVVLARRRALAGPPGAAVPARLDPYQAAFLNGGSALAATTAVTVRAPGLGEHWLSVPLG
jgi:hypothetical protein